MFNILIICTGNICRSPMAAGMLKAALPEELKTRIAVSSAGIQALQGHRAADHAVETMARRGIDIKGHRARQVTGEMIRTADLILTMEKAQLSQLRRLVMFGRPDTRMISEFGPLTGNPDIADPYGGTLEEYLSCAQALEPCTQGLVHWLSEAVNCKKF